MFNLNAHEDGTKDTGFVTGCENLLPRECGNCRWMSGGFCRHEDVMKDEAAIAKSRENLDKSLDSHGWVPVGEDWCCNYYQTRPLIIFFRHGETEANKAMKFRGFKDYELDEIGINEAHESGLLVQNIDFGAFFCSDLIRTRQTLDEICKVNKYSEDSIVDYTPSMRPWNIGDFTGQDKTDEAKALLEEFANNPNIPIPNGESLNEFRCKFTSLFNRALVKAKQCKKVIGLIGHASNGHELGHIIYNDIDSLDTDPGGVILVYEKNGKLEGEVIKNPPVEKNAGFGAS
jgi:2,3-bisphosphoglycerate-dependent phosphoglycerate mutase